METDVSSLNRIWGVLLVLVVAGPGCATYNEAVSGAKRDVAGGRPDAAVGRLNQAMGTTKRHELPSKLSGRNTLMLLERATVLQALGEYKLAARDMMLADQQLDWLDLGAQGKAKVGKYLYSGTSVKYRAPPYERLMLNTLNMLNFLALGDWEDAKVEARRFRIIEHFFVDKEDSSLLPGALAFGNYLGGVSFEAAGDYQEAAKYYARAWHHGIRNNRLGKRLGRLIQMTASNYESLVPGKPDKGSRPPSPSGSPPSWSAYRDKFVDGEILVVVQTGLAPYKKGKRFPVGRALTIAGTSSHSSYRLDAEQRKQAQELAVSGALKWVNFPVLTESRLPPDRKVSVRFGERKSPVTLGVDVARQVEHGWDKIKGELMVAAVTRMLTRAVAGKAAKEGVEQASSNSLLGMAAQVAVEGGMAVADTPDTRSWSLLPARIRFSRMHSQPGSRPVQVRVDGKTAQKSVEVRESGPTIVNFSRMR